LVCGKQQKTLRRHLGVAHQLTPEAYREQLDSGLTIPWPHPATPGSVPRWPSAWAWDSAFGRQPEPGSLAAARDPSMGGCHRESVATRIADDPLVSSAPRSGWACSL
jgi:hypothetical protein